MCVRACMHMRESYIVLILYPLLCNGLCATICRNSTLKIEPIQLYPADLKFEAQKYLFCMNIDGTIKCKPEI